MMNTPPLTEGWSAPPVWRLCVLRASLSGIGFHTHRLKGLLFNLFCARQSARRSGAGASHTHTRAHTHSQPPPKSSRHHQETELTTAPTLRQNTAPAVCICHNNLGNNTHTHHRDPRNDRRDWRASADCEVAFLRVSHLSLSQTACLLTN